MDFSNYTLPAQISLFTENNLSNYIVGLPIIFGVMLLVYSIIKFVFAGSSKPDKDKARRLIILSIIIILVFILGYAVYSWIFTGSSQPDSGLPSIFE